MATLPFMKGLCVLIASSEMQVGWGVVTAGDPDRGRDGTRAGREAETCPFLAE
jgi:hypothetical protein